MNKSGQITIAALVLFFIGAIVALTLFTQIINTQATMTDKLPVYNETSTITLAIDYGGDRINLNSTPVFTLVKAPTGWQAGGDCPIGSFTVDNQSGNAALTLDTDFNITTSTGEWALINTTASVNAFNSGDNTSYVSYNYCDDGYVNSTAGRSITGLISLMAALAIIGFAVWAGISKMGFFS